MLDAPTNSEEREGFSVTDNNNSVKASPSSLDKSQKIAMVFLVFFSLAIIAMWGAQFRRAVNAPFNSRSALQPVAGQDCPGGICGEAGEIDLRLIDTDGDGISDYDEIYIYKTSPYLADTDGDGISDHDEIFIYNSDPNCPAGQDCQGSFWNPNYYAGETAPIEPLLPPLQTDTRDDIRLQDLFTEEMDPADLRLILLAAGMSAEALDQISDEELLHAYRGLLAEQ